MSSRADDDDDEFQALFGDCIDADAIEQIKNNDPNRDTYYADFEDDFEDVPNEAWERLGSYIAGNDHLRRIDFSECSLGVALFRGLAAKGGSLRGIVELSCEHNRGIDSTCFDLLLDSLEGGAIEILNVGSCSIQNPIALARCTLPNLRMLNLSRNGITDLPPEALAKLTHLESLYLGYNKLGEGAIRALADLLQNEECTLTHLQLRSTSMDDTGAIIIAESLKCNTKLQALYLKGNRIGDEGAGAFLRLLNDVSSIKKTEGSNHTLMDLGSLTVSILHTAAPSCRVMARLNLALEINVEHEGNPEAAGKVKVRETQLCRRTREELARLQGIECPGYHQMFSDLDAVLLPDVLALVGEHNQERNELYPVVVGNAYDLVSLVDREAMLRAEEAKNEARIAAITAELARLNVVNSRIRGQLITMEAEKRVGHASGNKRSRDSAAEN